MTRDHEAIEIPPGETTDPSLAGAGHAGSGMSRGRTIREAVAAVRAHAGPPVVSLPVVSMGIFPGEHVHRATEATEAGADGIVTSNHRDRAVGRARCSAHTRTARRRTPRRHGRAGRASTDTACGIPTTGGDRSSEVRCPEQGSGVATHPLLLSL